MTISFYWLTRFEWAVSIKL